ncbi:MAG: prepilin-type N-terminal cleavage/methylation domain-containing protein [Deltaproteobacteria bacterium]|nr:prepilin-type N-terminal cleavage/methylation domain-containing protein [Deltaproteobacteria bacterium]
MASITRARLRDERGFTLIEIMVVVVVIGILAAVVVPQFMSESRKVKGSSEVNAMFAEISTKQEIFKSENGSYRVMAACPSTPSAQAQSIATCEATADWTALRIHAPEQSLRCSYAVVTGAAGVAPTPPSGFSLQTNPANGWYYALATCDLDGQTGTNSTYLTSSLDSSIQVQNEGK